MEQRATVLARIRASGVNPYVVCAVTFRRTRFLSAVLQLRAAQAIDRALLEFASGTMTYEFDRLPRTDHASPTGEEAHLLLVEIGASQEGHE